MILYDNSWNLKTFQHPISIWQHTVLLNTTVCSQQPCQTTSCSMGLVLGLYFATYLPADFHQFVLRTFSIYNRKKQKKCYQVCNQVEATEKLANYQQFKYPVFQVRQCKSVEKRKEEYNKVRALIFSSTGVNTMTKTEIEQTSKTASCHAPFRQGDQMSDPLMKNLDLTVQGI